MLGESDTPGLRQDLENCGVRPELWLGPRLDGRTYIKPQAPYAFTPMEKRQFMDLLGSISVPTGYSAELSKHIMQGKLGHMKSHDHHVVLQDILPVCIRHILRPGPRNAIIRLGGVFQRITAKVIDPTEMDDLRLFTAETLSLLEQWLPESFFDVMTHLVIHLPDELAICRIL